MAQAEMKPFITIFVSLIVSLTACAMESREGLVAIPLRTSVEIAGTSIFLSDLVPSDAPDFVREEGARILVGAAPLAGATRVLAAHAIAAALERAGIPTTVFVIPDRMVVRRAVRPLSARDALFAIERYLVKHPAMAIRGIEPDDIKVDAGLSVPSDPRIEVVGLAFDKTLQVAQFRLKIQGAANADPICVRVRMPALSSYGRQPIPTKRTLVGLNEKQIGKPEVLVDPKTIARLHLHSAESDMVLDVRPLERGALEQTIRVRLASSAKTLQARVVGPNALDATF